MIDYFTENNVPLVAYLEPTLRCNVKCIHCYVEREIPGRELELTTGEIERVLGELAELGSLFLVVTGGEFFLRPDAVAIMRMARALGFALVVFTNGNLITEAIAAEMQALAPLGVEISIHGSDAQAHEGVTGIEGSFSCAAEAIRRLRKHGVRVKMKCNVLLTNAQSLGAAAEGYAGLARQLDAEYTVDPFIGPRRDRDGSPTLLRCSTKDINELVQQLRGRAGHPAKSPEGLLSRDDARLCGMAHNTITISSDGSVYPCIPLRLKAGNVREQPLRSIWESSRVFRHLRALRVRDLEQCRVCEQRDTCSRCSALAYNETGDLLGCSPFSKEWALSRSTGKFDSLEARAHAGMGGGIHASN